MDDAVEVAKRGFRLGEDVERAEPRRLVPLGKVEIGAELAGDCDATGEGQLPGNEQLAVEVEKGDVAPVAATSGSTRS